MGWLKSSSGMPGSARPVESLDSAAKQPMPLKKAGFTIHAAMNGETKEIQQTSPTLTHAKARGLFKSGWRVHVVDAAGRVYAPSEFDEILKFD